MSEFIVATTAMLIIADVFGLCVLLAYPPSLGEGGFIVGIYVYLLICTFVFLFFLPNSIKMIKQKKAKQKAEEESRSKAKASAETKKLIERYQFALQLVQRCKEENIRPLETEEGKSNLWLIDGSMGVKSKEESLALYKEGISPSKEILELIEKDKTEKHTKEREYELLIIRQYKENAKPDLIGRDKYTEWALELKSIVLREANVFAKLGDYGYSYEPMTRSAVKNPALESIKGELIGGIGLGTAKAIEALNANAQKAANQAKLAKENREAAKEFRDRAAELRAQTRIIDWYIDSVNSKLIDTEHSEKYASMIKGQATKAEATEGGNLKLTFLFTVEGEQKILGREAFLDGIFEITARLNEEIVGTTIYSPPVFTFTYDEMLCKQKPVEMCSYFASDIEKLKGSILTGFIPKVETQSANIYEFKDICIPTTTEVSDENLQSIRFEITPRQVWAVEGKRNKLYTF